MISLSTTNIPNGKFRITEDKFLNENNDNYYYIYYRIAPSFMCTCYSLGSSNDELVLKYKNEIYRFEFHTKLFYPLRTKLSSGWYADSKKMLKDFLIKEFKMIPKRYEESEIYCKLHVDYVDLSLYTSVDPLNYVPGF